MVFFSKSHLYPFHWEHVINAFWNKYPNDLQFHVRRVDIINFDFDEKNKILYTKRLFSLKYNSPKLLERIIGSNLTGIATEETMCNFNKRKLIANGSNYSFNNIFSIRETCTFTPSNENSESTLYTQDITFKLFQRKNKFKWINKLFENAVIQSFNEKSLSGIKAMYIQIDKIKSLLNHENKVKKSIYESPSFFIPNCLYKKI
ncbi:uncharacterized protein cubi_01827 [Cryptosporidium ubiquitum]|uniref:PRELI/MSF1 domain-containing protein n=1 Tax=Cryptosporidium ubiquitum TaxID=857276 RepID=A0A1J4MM10_9CRYT|nr:uncharacterized protein cubi_01827 [Cryptosporidium ubiquitum]OII75306.1 hypothetical protein cubi_01827 [Cryptosporidium ubiquitum]